MKTVRAENLEGSVFRLQFFAEGDSEESTDPQGGATGSEEKATTPRTYTAEELQSETDKRVTEALKTARAKWEKEWNKKMEEERSEAEKLGQLSEKERIEAELEKKQRKLEEDRASFERQKLELEVAKQLSTEGLSQDFAPFLMGKNAEESSENLKKFKGIFDATVESKVKERLSGNPPKASGGEKRSSVKGNPMISFAKGARIIKE